VFPAGTALADDVKFDEGNLESLLVSAESSLNARKFDLALSAIQPYLAFSAEEPRIAAVITAAYSFHFANGQQFVKKEEWKDAIAEFEEGHTPRLPGAVQPLAGAAGAGR
jgi:hypothetical protein